MQKGFILLALHAHLPYVRHPEYEDFLEERWLFEAIAETYLPLLRVFNRLEQDGIPWRIAMSLSPTLITMLEDKELQRKFLRYTERILELLGHEEQRTKDKEEYKPLLSLYRDLHEANLKDFTTLYEGHILKGYDYYIKKGRIEPLLTGATHAYLPLYSMYPEAIHAQIQAGLETLHGVIGKTPKGFWLPELGYYPGVESFLRDYGMQFFFAATHSILFMKDRPPYGIYAPVECPNGVFAFGRDVSSSHAVWSATEGYPGDFVYRDFYRDIGFDLPLEYISPFLPGGNIRVFTGLKYYAITSKGEEKKLYNPKVASKKVIEHAENFIYNRIKAVQKLSPLIDIPPVFVCPFDAELFGHWWFEGPQWIEALFRTLSRQSDIECIHPSQYLKSYKIKQKGRPVFSSWGNKGYSEVWLDGGTDWLYRHIHKALERMIDLVERYPDETGLKARALNQAAREVLLSQASDWPFIIHAGTT
ncbi:MAG: 1,4-alpha-glucan branching protein domain-containing protein, partial [Spirochaetales bacterium]